MKKYLIMAILLLLPMAAQATDAPVMPSLESFRIRPMTANEFRSFVEVFSEMRGPLRSEMMKDRKTDFEGADPLKYVMKIKGEKDVQKMLKKHDLSWDQFTELMGNVVLAYFSIQPDKTKIGLVRQLADYGLAMNEEQIPEQFRETVRDFIKTDEGAALAAMALDFFLQVPEQNIALVKENRRTLDATFYTRFWKDKI